MATGTIYGQGHVSELIRNGYAAGMAVNMSAASDLSDGGRSEFARIVRVAREQRGWNQDQLAEASGVSRPTIQRWETLKTGTPDPENARRVFVALGLDTRLIPVALGYVTAEEMGLPAETPRVFAPTVEQAIRILEDPNVPAAAKHEWVEFLTFRAAQAATENAAKRAS